MTVIVENHTSRKLQLEIQTPSQYSTAVCGVYPRKLMTYEKTTILKVPQWYWGKKVKTISG